MIKVSDFFKDLSLRDDAQVADFGCGVGENSKILAANLPKGKVFAVDVHKDLLEHLETDIKKEKIENIVPVWGNIENLDGSRLRDESVDAVIISNTFFLLIHKKTCILEMKRVLKRGGRILFVDWHKAMGQAQLHAKNVFHESEIEALFTSVDMKVFPLIHKDDNHFVLIIQK